VKTNKNSKEHGQECNILTEELNDERTVAFCWAGNRPAKTSFGTVKSYKKFQDNLSGKDKFISKKRIP
jgi:hypothetical protein